MAAEDDNARRAWVRCEDRTLYFTLSLYVDAGDVPADVAAALALKDALPPLGDFEGTQALRDAMDPLFNDVANRERLGRVEDYLLDTNGPPEGVKLNLITPRVITWTTEGTTFKVDLGAEQMRQARVRRFWYVHMNRAISYHVALAMTYEHTPADFYAISMLQKAAAPKEFKRPADGAGNVYSGRTGILPLDGVLFEDETGVRRSLWDFVARQFDADAKGLFAHIRKTAPDAQADAAFAKLVRQDPFLETPGLCMPRARFKFFFQDEAFFDALLPPPLPGADGALVRRRRIDCVPTAVYEAYPAAIQALIDAAEENDAADPDAPQEVAIPLADIAAIDPEHLKYLFLAGFNQNIIDFLNQDASEILDSTDPIYPANEDQEAESFFVRYANPRTLITYVKRSRSLETGNDWIGTCPYAFLIHTLALHNEYFVRAYEYEAEALVNNVQSADERGELREAAEKFYAFRKRQFSNYMRFRYQNVFRYDTEKDAFAEVERIRGVAKNVSYLEALVSGVEKQTHDLEERLKEKAKEDAHDAREVEEKHRRYDAERLTYLLGLLSAGTFGFDLIARLSDFAARGVHLSNWRLVNANWVDVFAMIVTTGVFLALVWIVIRYWPKKRGA
ncbi:MAG TPA: hypothetical protein PKY87_06005 [Terricaulis sp.]|nr:hypothetical protein [Terricaulis sp.]